MAAYGSELNKFDAGRIETEQERWIKFFKDGERLNDEALPDWMNTQEMKQAMSTLTAFSEKDRQYHQYQARQEYLREQRTIQHELEQAARDLIQERREKEAEKKRAEAEKQRAEAEKQRAEAALAEIEHLKALLAEKGQ